MNTGCCDKADSFLAECSHPRSTQHFPAICSSCGVSNHSNDDANCENAFPYQKISQSSPVIPMPYVQGQGREDFRKRRQRRRKIKRCLTLSCLFLLSVLTSAAICLLLLKYVKFPDIPNTGAESNHLTRICIPCGPRGEPVVSGRFGKATTETLTCCSQDEAQMRELVLEAVKLSLQERLQGDDLYNLLNNPLLPMPINRDAAHVYLRYHPSKHSNRRRKEEENDEFDVIKSWSKEGNTAFIRQGIEYSASQGHFIVKDAGIYVVYCRIVYENQQHDYAEDAEEQGEQTLVLGHSISSFAHNNYRNLLEDEQLTQCLSEGVCYNSQIFSTLYLSKGMAIAIRVRHIDYLSQSFQSSYFGIYKID